MQNQEFNRVPNEEVLSLAKKEEPRFLSLLLKDKECLSDAIASGIKSGNDGHFWILECQVMYLIIQQYYQKYQAKLTRTGIDSVMDSISEIGGQKVQEEDKVSVRAYWDKIYNMEVSKEDYKMLRDHVNSRYVQWKAYEIMQNNTERLVKSSGNQIDIVKDLQKRFQSIDILGNDSYSLTMGIKEGMEKALEYINQRREHPELSDSILTYINAIDDIYHGFPRGSYNIISGMINGGKSTLMVNIGFNMAKQGYHVVYVSLEKKAEPLFQRILSMHAMIDYNRIKVGGTGDKGLNDLVMRQFKAAKDDLEKINPNFDIIQKPQGTPLTQILNDIDKVHMESPVDVIIVDYLGVVGHETSHPGRPDLDEAITSQRLQAYGRINNFVNITGLQLKTASSKEIRGKAKKATSDSSVDVEVNTEDMAGSKMVIADADNALSIILNGDSPPTQAFVYGTKARDDQARSRVTLDFDGRLGLVTDPQIEPGQISDMADVLYNEEVEERDFGENRDDTLLFKNAAQKALADSDDSDEDLDAFMESIVEDSVGVSKTYEEDDLDDIFED